MVEKMTAEEFRAATAGKKGTKYKSKRITVDGINFDSQKEAGRWFDLNRLQDAGHIARLERQVKIPLDGKYHPIKTDSGNAHRTYVADFRYIDWRKNGIWVIEDSKGFETPEFKLKKAILEAQNVVITIT